MNGITKNTSESLMRYLRTLEQIYRSEMEATELALYVASLSSYPLSEVMVAGQELMLHPLDGWTGLPKLPDFLRTLNALREKRAADILQSGGKSLADPNCKVCTGSSWEPTTTAKGNRAVKRCQCWINAREALNASKST